MTHIARLALPPCIALASALPLLARAGDAAPCCNSQSDARVPVVRELSCSAMAQCRSAAGQR